VVSTDHEPSHASLLGPLAIVLAVLGASTLVRSVVRARLVAKLRSGGAEDEFSEVVSRLETLELVFFPVVLVCGVALAIIVFSLWRRLAPGRLATLALAAFALLALNVFIDVVLRIAEFAQLHSYLEFLWAHDSLIAILVLINALGLALLLWFLHERTSPGKRTIVVWLGAAALGLHTASTLYRVLSAPSQNTGTWTRLLLSTATFILALFVAAWLAWRERKSHEEDHSITSGLAWMPASRGIKLYERALVWRLVLTVSGYVLLIMAAQGHSRGMVETLSWAIPLMAIVTGSLMTIGVFRFANQPQGTQGRGPAALAGAMMAVALVMDLSLFASLLRVLRIDSDSAGYGDMSAARDALESAQSMAVWGMALSLAAFVALLISIHRVARYFDDEQIAGQAFSVGLRVVLMGAFAWGLRYWLGSNRRISLETAIFAASGILIAVLVLVISHLNLVGKLSARLAHASTAEPGNDDA